MARFWSSIQGERGAATRLGHRRIHAQAQGWNGGIRVEGRAIKTADQFDVFATTGSLAHGPERLIARVTVKDGRLRVAHIDST